MCFNASIILILLEEIITSNERWNSIDLKEMIEWRSHLTLLHSILVKQNENRKWLGFDFKIWEIKVPSQISQMKPCSIIDPFIKTNCADARAVCCLCLISVCLHHFLSKFSDFLSFSISQALCYCEHHISNWLEQHQLSKMMMTLVHLDQLVGSSLVFSIEDFVFPPSRPIDDSYQCAKTATSVHQPISWVDLFSDFGVEFATNLRSIWLLFLQ